MSKHLNTWVLDENIELQTKKTLCIFNFVCTNDKGQVEHYKTKEGWKKQLIWTFFWFYLILCRK